MNDLPHSAQQHFRFSTRKRANTQTLIYLHCSVCISAHARTRVCVCLSVFKYVSVSVRAHAIVEVSDGHEWIKNNYILSLHLNTDLVIMS